MRAACENCGKYGEMTPGHPFVCEVCGYRHGTATVDARIAAAARAADAKVAEERAAREKMEAERRARERLIASLKPKTAPHPSTVPAAAIKPPPRRAEPYTDPFARRPAPPPPPPRPHRTDSPRMSSGRAGEWWLGLKILIVAAAIIWGVKACYLTDDSDDVQESQIAARPSTSRPMAKPRTSSPSTQTHVPAPQAGHPMESSNPVTVWTPGQRHPKQQHIYATEKPGVWALDKGYELVHPGTDDWSVRKVTVYSQCRKCAGSGVTERRVTCPTCHGRRSLKSPTPVLEFRNGRQRSVYKNIPCPTCRGGGRVIERRTCPSCNGSRVVPTKGVR